MVECQKGIRLQKMKIADEIREMQCLNEHQERLR